MIPTSCRGVVSLLLVMVAGCGGKRPLDSGTTIADSAGVAIATAPAADTPLGWTLTEVFRLGGAEDGPGSFTAASPFTTGTDAAGNIYVLDAQEFRVEVFGPSGEPVRFLGREGGGPGELGFPISMFVAPSGIVHVFDINKRGLVRWDASGELLPTLSLQGVSFGTMKVFGDTLIFDEVARTPEAQSSRLLHVVGSDTTELAALSGPGGGMVEFSCVSFAQPPLFSPVLQWTASGSLAAATHQTPYQVDVFRGGHLVRSIRRPMAAKPASLDDVARLYPEGMKIRFSAGGGAGACTIPASEIMEKQGVAESVPQIRSLVLDLQDRLWVERYTFQDEPGLVDVFTADGRYLGTLSGKGPPLGFVGADMVLFAEEDLDTGVRQVVAYRIGGGS